MKLTNHILEAIQRGINLAIDDFDDMDIETQKTGQIKHSLNTQELINYSYFVDLGLPSGTLWGKYNIGVNPRKLNKADDWNGGYYAWGEIEEKQEYSWKTYKYANGNYDRLTKYCTSRYCDSSYKPDYLITLQDEDDVAVQTNKLSWNIKMPIKKQFNELLKYTTSDWVNNYQGIIGLNGMMFISKQNRNEIFIPAAGFLTGSSVYHAGSYGCVWSSSLRQASSYGAHNLQFFRSSVCYMHNTDRCNGYSVRAVLIN